MTSAEYQAIMEKVNYLEWVARTDCGCFVQECVADVKAAVIACKPQDN